MFLLRSTFYALQIFFILSNSDFVIGKLEPYFPVIGVSVTRPILFKVKPIRNDYIDDADNDKFDYLDKINNDDEDLRKRILQALKDQWQHMEKAFGSDLEDLNKRKSLRKLRL